MPDTETAPMTFQQAYASAKEEVEKPEAEVTEEPSEGETETATEPETEQTEVADQSPETTEEDFCRQRKQES